MIEPALALIDFGSVAAGIEAADAMAKRAQIDVIPRRHGPARRYLVLIGGRWPTSRSRWPRAAPWAARQSSTTSSCPTFTPRW